jgi:hypothetical protein
MIECPGDGPGRRRRLEFAIAARNQTSAAPRIGIGADEEDVAAPL